MHIIVWMILIMLLSCDWLPLPSHSWSMCHGSNSTWITDSGHTLFNSVFNEAVLKPKARGHNLTHSIWACTLSRWSDHVMRKHIAHALWTCGRCIATYMHTYTHIHRYSKFTVCYSCIQGSLRLAPNDCNTQIYSYRSVAELAGLTLNWLVLICSSPGLSTKC